MQEFELPRLLINLLSKHVRFCQNHKFLLWNQGILISKSKNLMVNMGNLRKFKLNMKLFNLKKLHWKITPWFCASFLNKSSNTIFKLSYLCVVYRFSYFNITNSRSRLLSSVLKPGPARRVDPGPGRPGPGTGPGGGKNPLGNWLGETRSTRSNPGETRSIFFLPLPLLFLRPPHPGLLHLLPKEQNPSWRSSIEIHTLHLLLTSIHYNRGSPISLLRHQWRRNPLLLFPQSLPFLPPHLRHHPLRRSHLSTSTNSQPYRPWRPNTKPIPIPGWRRTPRNTSTHGSTPSPCFLPKNIHIPVPILFPLPLPLLLLLLPPPLNLPQPLRFHHFPFFLPPIIFIIIRPGRIILLNNHRIHPYQFRLRSHLIR